MRSAAFVSWLLTVSLGAFMLRTWLARGGLRRERARAGGLPPQLVFSHGGLAVTGLLIWSAFLASGIHALAWTAIGVMMAAITLGLCTVTLWTPYPAHRPGERRTPTPWDERAAVVPDTPEAATARKGADPLGYEVTDEMIARFLDDPSPAARRGPVRPIRPNPAVLVPIAHGFGAISTFVLAVLAAVR